jgi:hypothetical protein
MLVTDLALRVVSVSHRNLHRFIDSAIQSMLNTYCNLGVVTLGFSLNRVGS